MPGDINLKCVCFHRHIDHISKNAGLVKIVPCIPNVSHWLQNESLTKNIKINDPYSNCRFKSFGRDFGLCSKIYITKRILKNSTTVIFNREIKEYNLVKNQS